MTTIQRAEQCRLATIQQLESQLKLSADWLHLEKKKTAVLSSELEQSLKDEMSLRSYCLQLESDVHRATGTTTECKAKVAQLSALLEQGEQQTKLHINFHKAVAGELATLIQLISVDADQRLPAAERDQLQLQCETREGVFSLLDRAK